MRFLFSCGRYLHSTYINYLYISFWILNFRNIYGLFYQIVFIFGDYAVKCLWHSYIQDLFMLLLTTLNFKLLGCCRIYLTCSMKCLTEISFHIHLFFLQHLVTGRLHTTMTRATKFCWMIWSVESSPSTILLLVSLFLHVWWKFPMKVLLFTSSFVPNPKPLWAK